eukprot:TRINITY_DN33803_c0_g1_i1.p1 TRINITY_DN33803_c0_g1~~TRINITY_DN33803_c0_g1_i1.p1  ORF type:complete len:362 (-),score=37.88 TRINITY_DN33803_c0_g1_i1:39-1124(-)
MACNGTSQDAVSLRPSSSTATQEAKELVHGKPPKLEPWWQLAGYIALWWSTAVLVVLLVKSTVKPGSVFPHAFTFTTLAQVVTTLMAWALSYILQLQQKTPAPPLQNSEFGILMLVGLMQGVEIGLTNKALQWISVSHRTMINSTNVLFIMISARFWGLEKVDFLRMVSAILLMVGGIAQCFDYEDSRHGTTKLQGVIVQIISCLISSQRWCLVQYIMQRSSRDSALGQMSKLAMLARILPMTCVDCLLLCLFFEPEAFALSNFSFSVAENVSVVATALTLMLWMEFLLVSRLSAVAFNVLSSVHQVPIVLAGVAVLHNKVTIMGAAGFLLCIVGASVYAVARHMENKSCNERSDARSRDD